MGAQHRDHGAGDHDTMKGQDKRMTTLARRIIASWSDLEDLNSPDDPTEEQERWTKACAENLQLIRRLVQDVAVDACGYRWKLDKDPNDGGPYWWCKAGWVGLDMFDTRGPRWRGGLPSEDALARGKDKPAMFKTRRSAMSAVVRAWKNELGPEIREAELDVRKAERGLLKAQARLASLKASAARRRA